MKHNRLLLSIFILLLIFAACRKQWNATEEDMADYGWTLYEQGEYLDSYEWFSNSIQEDLDYQDGYNGLGWTFGKLVELDSAVQVFDIGLTKPQNPRMIDIVAHDILAGLTFAHSALKHDSSVVHYGDSLIWLIKQKIGEKTWIFPHDSTTNYLDVHVTLALSYYALSDFAESLGHVQSIKTALNPASPPYVVNTTTIVGRDQLAAEIEYLQNYLRGR
jgi:tetratricopeptide (TPR) repeat protein